MIQAITETLLTPVTYSPEQKQLIVRIMESTITESLLRETCAHALNRSV